MNKNIYNINAGDKFDSLVDIIINDNIKHDDIKRDIIFNESNIDKQNVLNALLNIKFQREHVNENIQNYQIMNKYCTLMSNIEVIEGSNKYIQIKPEINDFLKDTMVKLEDNTLKFVKEDFTYKNLTDAFRQNDYKLLEVYSLELMVEYTGNYEKLKDGYDHLLEVDDKITQVVYNSPSEVLLKDDIDFSKINDYKKGLVISYKKFQESGRNIEKNNHDDNDYLDFNR